MTSAEPRSRQRASGSVSRWALVTGFFLVWVPVGAGLAGDWRLTDSVTASMTAVDRTGNDAESGLVAQVSPGIRLSGEGARARADLSYRLTASVGLGDIDPRGVSHNLNANGQVEVVEDFFFLGGRAGARLVGDSLTSGPVDPINDEGSQSFSLAVLPEFRHRLNRYANLVSRNAIDYVTYSGDGRDDSYSTTVNLGVLSGPEFGPVNWTLDATQRRTEFEDRSDKNASYTAGVGYRVSGRWAVSATAGYEENDVSTLRTDTDGFIWNVGTVWTPNPRTSLDLTYGERYIGEVYSGTFSHRSRKTLLRVSLSRDVSNRRFAELEDAFFFLVDADGNPVTDPLTGDPLVVNIPQLQQVDEDFINTQLQVAISATGRRTTVTATATAAQRDYEVSGDEEESYGFALSANRRLGGDYSASAGASVRRAEDNTGGDTDTYDLRFSLSRQITRRTSASLDFLHRNQDSVTNDYTENRIGLSLTTSFL